MSRGVSTAVSMTTMMVVSITSKLFSYLQFHLSASELHTYFIDLFNKVSLSDASPDHERYKGESTSDHEEEDEQADHTSVLSKPILLAISINPIEELLKFVFGHVRSKDSWIIVGEVSHIIRILVLYRVGFKDNLGDRSLYNSLDHDRLLHFYF